MKDTGSTRREFLQNLPTLGALLAVAGAARPAMAAGTRAGAGAPRGDHPEPRPGIDASKVTPRAKLADPDMARLFDQVREMPRICDGLACRCGCHEDPAMRSLLTCFEGDGMATHCTICQAQAEATYRLFRRGRSLAEIRVAIDAEFG